MSCCIEEAIVAALRALTCTPIRSENHFTNIRQCEECVPYVVVTAGLTEGLVTSSGRNPGHSVTITSYFAGPSDSMAMNYKDQIETWLSASGCLDLLDCGCFCVERVTRSQITVAQNGLYRYQAFFSGRYRRLPVSSASGSD